MHIGIVGAGLAGVAAAEVAAKRGSNVVLFSAEAALPYFRPRIVEVAAGNTPEEAITVHPRAWFDERGIELRLASPVESVDVSSDGFQVRAGTSIERVDRLILATGAGPFTPPLYATPRARLSPLWTLAHARHIASKLTPGSRLCVIGGGILGIELALAAAQRGDIRVTIVEMAPRLMGAQLCEPVASTLEAVLERRGIDVRTNASIASFEDRPDALALCLTDSSAIAADQVVYSLGARPSMALARTIGVATGRGIQVNASLETSIPGIFACGDVAEFAGITRSIALEAVKQGRVAGENAAGGAVTYQSASVPLSYRQPGFEILAIGPAHPEGAEIRDIPVEAGICTLVLQDGKIVGVQAIDARDAFRQFEKRIGETF
ncbi:MAG: FAD-dependent oxidoreductase [Myxococcales bacterium]|jgi:NAD(P)H-nitrite reductase large subunit|nr:FAD-dependent oxidoreductase [Myxococcales bacterium]